MKRAESEQNLNTIVIRKLHVFSKWVYHKLYLAKINISTSNTYLFTSESSAQFIG